jgi:pilus assembly protein Flp/PilA
MREIMCRFVEDEQGATAIEYGLIAAIVGVGIIGGLGGLKNSLNSMFNQVKSNLSGSN